jgi:hypothetical protein
MRRSTDLRSSRQRLWARRFWLVGRAASFPVRTNSRAHGGHNGASPQRYRVQNANLAIAGGAMRWRASSLLPRRADYESRFAQPGGKASIAGVIAERSDEAFRERKGRRCGSGFVFLAMTEAEAGSKLASTPHPNARAAALCLAIRLRRKSSGEATATSRVFPLRAAAARNAGPVRSSTAAPHAPLSVR